MRRRRILVTFLLLTACTVVGANCSADHLILGENHERINPPKARREVVRVQGRNVEYWIARSPSASGREPEAFVLFFIGKGDRSDRWIDRIAESWGDRPVEVWGMNYPGSGGSDGPVRVDQVGPDALAVFDAAKVVAGDRPIFVLGGSFGTTAALCVAAKRPVAGAIIQNPPPLKQLIRGEYGWWNLWLIAGPVAEHVPDDLDSIANGSHCTAPAIFIMSGRDYVIPPKYHEMVESAYAGPKRRIDMPWAGHDDGLTHEAVEALKDGKAWIWELAQQKPVH